MFTFELPWPPSVNGYWRTFRSRQIISSRGREYRKICIDILGGVDCTFAGPLRVEIDYHPPTLRKYDIDNFCKGVFDGITHAGLWEDDELVYILTLQKKEKIAGGKAIVRIAPLSITEKEELHYKAKLKD